MTLTNPFQSRTQPSNLAPSTCLLAFILVARPPNRRRPPSLQNHRRFRQPKVNAHSTVHVSIDTHLVLIIDALSEGGGGGVYYQR